MRSLFVIAAVFFAVMAAAAAPGDFAAHIESANDVKLSMNARWKALMSAAENANAQQSKDIEQIKNFSKNTVWYMRNASLIALKKVNHNEAEAIAKKLLSDKALVVRSAAVEVMADNLNEENKKALMAELNQSYNFHKKNSLWIRKQIANHLMLVAQDSDRDFFVKNLFDHDRTIAEICAAALEKITGINIGGADSVEKWKKTVATKKWLAD